MAPVDPTQSLLRWGIENAAPNSLLPLHQDIEAGRRPDLNTDVLKAIMGTSDADRMRECVAVIEGTWKDREGNQQASKDDLYRAWDDLEMVCAIFYQQLVEDIDNANDLSNLGLWKPIVSHLTSDDDEIAMRACWVCGTAVQNNPKAQNAFLALDPLPTITSLITSTSTPISTRNKAMYCLSSTLKHSEKAVERFSELDGWSTLNRSLQDPSQILRTKSAFLLSQLISQTASVKKLLNSLRKSGTLTTLLKSISNSSSIPTGPDGDSSEIDPDYRDKVLRFFVNCLEKDSSGLEMQEKTEVRQVVMNLEEEGWKGEEELGMSEQEWKTFKEGLSQ